MQAHVSTQTRLIIFFSIMSSLPFKKILYRDLRRQAQVFPASEF